MERNTRVRHVIIDLSEETTASRSDRHESDSSGDEGIGNSSSSSSSDVGADETQFRDRAVASTTDSQPLSRMTPQVESGGSQQQQARRPTPLHLDGVTGGVDTFAPSLRTPREAVPDDSIFENINVAPFAFMSAPKLYYWALLAMVKNLKLGLDAAKARAFSQWCSVAAAEPLRLRLHRSVSPSRMRQLVSSAARKRQPTNRDLKQTNRDSTSQTNEAAEKELHTLQMIHRKTAFRFGRDKINGVFEKRTHLSCYHAFIRWQVYATYQREMDRRKQHIVRRKASQETAESAMTRQRTELENANLIVEQLKRRILLLRAFLQLRTSGLKETIRTLNAEHRNELRKLEHDLGDLLAKVKHNFRTEDRWFGVCMEHGAKDVEQPLRVLEKLMKDL